MFICNVSITGYRLLRNVKMKIDKESTLVVGRNNSGKTSLSEIFRRLIEDKKFNFKIEDFSISEYKKFWNAYVLYRNEADLEVVKSETPQITLTIDIDYSDNLDDYAGLGEFIVDLDTEQTVTSLKLTFGIKDGNLRKFYSSFNIDGELGVSPTSDQNKAFFKDMNNIINAHFDSSVVCFDPENPNNYKNVDFSDLEKVFFGGFISAQRGLNDVTHRENDVLGKIVENIFTNKTKPRPGAEPDPIVEELKNATADVEGTINNTFNNDLVRLIPGLSMWGYPGVGAPEIVTETIFDVAKLLINNTKVKYLFSGSYSLPESYNGLGNRNLFYIYLKIYESFIAYKSKPTLPCCHMVFIEEPEAHLHPQMQEVFIEQLYKVKELFELSYNEGELWPVQFVLTTHSSHMLVKGSFSQVRYFKKKHEPLKETNIKDLSLGLSGNGFEEHRDFLYQYLSLTRCDLFFADKIILIEGTTERVLLPKLFEKFDLDEGNSKKITPQYIAVLEVGGAYAHKFYDLIKFLELPSLVITDLDSIKQNDEAVIQEKVTKKKTTKKTIKKKTKKKAKKCKVSAGTHTSNGCLKEWFSSDISPEDLISKCEDDKVKNQIRIAYQVPEDGDEICGRSFEEAFMLANKEMFKLGPDEDIEEQIWESSRNIKKADFAIKYAIETLTWNTPKYIKEGLKWIAEAELDLESEEGNE